MRSTVATRRPQLQRLSITDPIVGRPSPARCRREAPASAGQWASQRRAGRTRFARKARRSLTPAEEASGPSPVRRSERNGRESSVDGGQEFRVDGKAGPSPIGAPDLLLAKSRHVVGPRRDRMLGTTSSAVSRHRPGACWPSRASVSVCRIRRRTSEPEHLARHAPCVRASLGQAAVLGNRLQACSPTCDGWSRRARRIRPRK